MINCKPLFYQLKSQKAICSFWDKQKRRKPTTLFYSSWLPICQGRGKISNFQEYCKLAGISKLWISHPAHQMFSRLPVWRKCCIIWKRDNEMTMDWHIFLSRGHNIVATALLWRAATKYKFEMSFFLFVPAAEVYVIKLWRAPPTARTKILLTHAGHKGFFSSYILCERASCKIHTPESIQGRARIFQSSIFFLGSNAWVVAFHLKFYEQTLFSVWITVCADSLSSLLSLRDFCSVRAVSISCILALPFHTTRTSSRGNFLPATRHPNFLPQHSHRVRSPNLTALTITKNRILDLHANRRNYKKKQ